MTIDLFVYNGPRKKLNKTITVIQRDIPIHLLDDTDVVNPIIELETSGVGTMSQIISANYAKISDFGDRTYFIVKKDVTNNNIMRLYLHSDPLYSFRHDVVDWSGIVEVVDDHGRNSYLDDQPNGLKGIYSNSNYRPSVNGSTGYRSLGSTTFKNSAFYLVTSGFNPVSGILPQYLSPVNSGMYTIYTHDNDIRGFKELSEKLWSLSPDNIAAAAILRPTESIISLHILPFKLTGAATHDVNAGYMTYELENTVVGVGSPYQHFDLGIMTIIDPQNTEDFKYYQPYRQYKMFLPFLGFIDINPNNFLRADDSGNQTYCECQITYDVNVMTGDFVATLKVPHRSLGVIVPTQYEPKEVHTGNMAVRIPVCAGDATALLSGAGNVLTSGVGQSVITGIGNAGKWVGNEMYDMGASMADAAGNANARLQKTTAPNYAPLSYSELPEINSFPEFSIGGTQKGGISGSSLYMGGQTEFWYDVVLYESSPVTIMGPHGSIQGYPFATQGVLSLNDLVNNFGFQIDDFVQFRNVLPLMSTGMTTAECDEITQILTGGFFL